MIYISGGYGFLGSHIYDLLKPKEQLVVRTRSKELDLTNGCQVDYFFNGGLYETPSVVIHAAADVGGIEYNMRNGLRLMQQNIQMGQNIINACIKHKTPKLILIGSVCSYPGYANLPISEGQLWDGYPEESNAGYGLAKRIICEMGIQAASKGLNVVNLLLTNLYGPRDSFDPRRSHVVPAMIKKFVDAVKGCHKSVECWGSGIPTRDLLYVEDAASAVVAALDANVGPQPINIATGEETSVAELAAFLADAIGFSGEVVWNKNKPNGQIRRRYSTIRASKELGWAAQTKIETGLVKTVEWYLANQSQ